MHGVVMAVVFLMSRTVAPQFFGTAAIALAAVTAWIALGTWLIIFLSRSKGPPGIVVVVLIAALFSFWNDNHRVGRGVFEVRADTGADTDNREGESRSLAARLPYEAHIWRWLVERADVICGDGWAQDGCVLPEDANGDAGYPVVFLAAEGGGLRAAYATGVALGRVEDETGCGLSRHLLGAVGVSGGSLGIASYLATRSMLQDTDCGPPPADGPVVGPYQRTIEEHLGQDYLAPAVAGLLFSDLIWRLNPLPAPLADLFPDRAEFIEQSWCVGWERVLAAAGAEGVAHGPHRACASIRDAAPGFGHDLTAVAARAGPAGQTGPAVAFMTTSVKSGRQWAVSNVEVDRAGWTRRRDLVGLLERSRIPDPRLSLAEAAHMSARFTLISPAGRIDWTDCGLRLDGEQGAITAVLDIEPEECHGTLAEARDRIGHDEFDAALEAAGVSVAGEARCAWRLVRSPRRGRFVDGGYFENSGAVAAERMMRAFERSVDAVCRLVENGRPPEGLPQNVPRDDAEIRRILENAPAPTTSVFENLWDAAKAMGCPRRRLDLIALVVDGDPAAALRHGHSRHAQDRVVAAAPEKSRWRDGLASETLSPLNAVMAARGARGDEAVDDLKFTLEQRRKHFAPGETGFFTARIEIGAGAGQTQVPLGWLLSNRSQATIRDSLQRDGELDKLILRLKPASEHQNARAPE